MATYNENFEGGADGVALSTGNTSFSGVTIGAGCTLEFDDSWAHQGTKSARIVAASTVVVYGELACAATKQFAFRFYFRATTNTDANATILFNPRHSGGNICSIRQHADGTFRAADSAGGAMSQSGYGGAVAAGTLVRIEGIVTVGTTTSNGRLQWAWYPSDSTTAGYSYDSTAAVNMGTADLAVCRIGKLSTAGAFTGHYDALTVETGGTSFIGPYVEPPAGWALGAIAM